MDCWPVTTPANLGEHLLAYAFTVDSDTTPGMVADLRTLNEDNTCPGDVSIQQVTDLAMLATFYDMLRVGYGMPDAVIDFASSADRQAGTSPCYFSQSCCLPEWQASWLLVIDFERGRGRNLWRGDDSRCAAAGRWGRTDAVSAARSAGYGRPGGGL